MDKSRIIIIEDEALIAIELKSTLKLLGYEVVGHAMNGDKALDLFAKTEADLVILDINIKGTRNGIDLAHILKDKYDMPYVFLTSFSDRMTLNKVKETSPYGYIVKPFTDRDLQVNIELAIHKFDSETAKQDLSKDYLESKYSLSLSDRDYEILMAFKDGLTYKEAADQHFISVNTVKTYQKRLFQMFNVSSKFELLQKMV